ncbi:MAG: hypothetical protein HY268_11125 [Deltaproteobacteria bacterium]|nr:hypothetical protein [Deltaproteobacteria bacterium]
MSVLTSAFDRPSQRDPLAIFLFFSLLLHLLLFLFLPLSRPNLLAPPPEELATVELLSEPLVHPPAAAKIPPPTEKPEVKEKPAAKETPEAKEKPEPKPEERMPEQIVSPSEQNNDQVPEKTRFLSERNNSTKKETVAVGTPRPAPPQKEKTPAKEKPEAQKPPVQLALKTPTAPPPPKPPVEKEGGKTLNEAATPRSSAPGKPDAPAKTPELFARPDDLLAQGWLAEAGGGQEKKAERLPPTGRDIMALAPPPAPKNFLSLPGPSGTPDYLPDVQPGNLTFLNTKAHRFAPFVRRVAMRVFQHLIIHQRKNLHLDDVVAAREMVQIEAKLDTKGNLKGLVIQTRSGSYSVDESLLKACEQGAWDENPPPEAQAEDGYIHFIFRSDINAQYDQLGLRAIVTLLQVGLA